MINSNKITNTKIGDDIHFYINGTEDRGIVVKMSNEYVTVFKESTQDFDDIHINDTFFIKDILINKEWDKMDDQERWEALDKIHAPTPRFIMKSWNDLPNEIKELLTKGSAIKKNNAIETSHKEGKDDDMNITARIFDKGEGGTGRTIGEDQTAGEVIEGRSTNVDSARGGGGSKNISAGDKKQGKKHGKQQIRTNPEIKPDTHGHGVRSESHEEGKLGEGSKGSKNTEGIDYMTEGGGGIGTGDIDLGQAAEEQQAKYNKQQMDRKREERGQRRSDTAAQGGKVGSKVTTAMSKLKAWQLWLKKREQELLKAHELGEEDKQSDFQWHKADSSDLLRTDKPERTAEGKRSKKPANYGEGDAERVGRADNIENRPSNEYNKDRKIKAWEEWLEKIAPAIAAGVGRAVSGVASGIGNAAGNAVAGKLSDKPDEEVEKSFYEQWLEDKSNPERSIHGNAGREPNSGVNTNIGFDASEDYEGFTHSGLRPEQFKHERKKPKVTTKERVNIGETYPSRSSQGTGDGGNPYNTVTQNKDKKGRAITGEDRN